MSFPAETAYLIPANIGSGEMIMLLVFLVVLAVLGAGFVGLIY